MNFIPFPKKKKPKPYATFTSQFFSISSPLPLFSTLISQFLLQDRVPFRFSFFFLILKETSSPKSESSGQCSTIGMGDVGKKMGRHRNLSTEAMTRLLEFW
ncbi:hypothetical protein ACOSQ2_022324 [Xanthoceras sorbifolium]